MGKSLEARVAELEKKVKELTGEKQVRFSKKLRVGDTFELFGLEWKILEITGDGYKCLASRLEDGMQFDTSCNNWTSSDLRNYLNTEFYKELAEAVGEENIIPFERNLLSLDGQTEYGTCEDKVSIISVDEYQEHRALIPNADYWWWTLTPWSTPCNDIERSVTVVSASGFIDYGDFDCSIGVRPVCIFSSAIFESEEE